MSSDRLVKCPVCGVSSHVQKPELVDALNDPNIRQQIKEAVAKVLRGAPGKFGPQSANEQGRNFQQDVHKWNTTQPMWLRSQKE